MEIFLLILKIIGLTLLSVLGILIVLLLLVLFVPIRYNITVSNQQKDDGKLYVRARATWLLHLVNVLVSYYEELFYRVRITFIKIISSDKREKDKKRRKEKSGRKKNGKDEIKTAAESVVTAYEPDIDDTDEDLDAELFENINEENAYGDEPEDDRKLFDKAKEVIQKIAGFIFNLPDKITGVIEKVNYIKKNADYYIRAVNDERNQEAFSRCLNEIFKILKSIKPRKLTGRLLIGREDAYSYGQICSILGIVYPFIHDKISIETKDTEDITSYHIYTKGKVTLFVLLIAFIRIYFNKDVKRMIRIFKREGKGAR